MTDQHKVYLQTALAFSALSHGVRAKVGAVYLTKNGVLIPGVNGLRPGGSNVLETVAADGSLVTKPEVIHAELNGILKAAKEGISLHGAVLYCTLQPCLACSEMLCAAGIREVYYLNEYRDKSGLLTLQEAGVRVQQIDL